FQFIHRIKEQPWKQRNFRFYDADHHVLEIAEKMDIVLHRLQQEGHSIEEMARLTGYTESRVLQELEKRP
ncbi:MAG: glyoxalase/bleomycin resistance/dioxygenase family protein, partial [Anaerolineae bacterium]|nr:glyoxalase/bleomycin resistance/dioxygenase family protein [Anaerolineae bacterium]